MQFASESAFVGAAKVAECALDFADEPKGSFPLRATGVAADGAVRAHAGQSAWRLLGWFRARRHGQFG